MPNPAIKFTVLALSLGLGAACVWNAARGNRPAESVTSSPPGPAGPAEKPVIVTDEEVAAQRELLLNSSKSGRVMSDTAIRKMLEDKKRPAATKAPKEGSQDPKHLIPSSKSIDSVLGPAELKDLKDVLPLFRQENSVPPKEEPKTPSPAPEMLIPSSKSAPIFRTPEEVKNAVESITEPTPAKKE